MGFSVANPQGTSTILAELTLAEAQATQDAEGLTLPQELTDGEPLQQQPGALRGEAKHYTFIKQEGSYLSQKLADSVFEMNRPTSLKLADPKSGLHHLTFKESAVKEKNFKTIEPQKQNLEGKPEQQTTATRTPLQPHEKANLTARQALVKSQLPESAARVRENALKQQQSTTTRSLEQRVHKELDRKESRPPEQRKAAEGRDSTRTAQREAEPPQHNRLDKNEEREQQRERQQREEEEGFADGGQRGSHQDADEGEEHGTGKVQKIDGAFAKEFNSYAAEESILSQIFNMRMSQFDVLILFIEIMKLDIKGREQQKIARQDERALQLIHMQKVVDNYKQQSKWLLFSSLGSGVMAIVSGVAPIAGHMKGDWILQKLGGVFSSLRDMKKDQFFKSITKITMAMSQMQESTGKIQSTFSDGHRTFDEHMSSIYRSDWEERGRTLEDIKDDWKGIENFIYQTLQMHHDAIRSLYN